jgi:hypothetical protein
MGGVTTSKAPKFGRLWLLAAIVFGKAVVEGSRGSSYNVTKPPLHCCGMLVCGTKNEKEMMEK